MIPFFSRMFPGTNLQDLNLDWIVRRIMELSKGIIAPWINAQNQHWMVYDTAAETFVDSGVSAAGEGIGPGVAPGGNVGDILVKNSSLDFDTAWSAALPENVSAINTGALFPALTGKKINLIGDSISNDAQDWPAYIPDINDISLNNISVSGIKISGSDGIATRLAQLSNDADINILFAGTNDYNAQADIGKITDSTNATFYGALNIILDYINTNIPNSKTYIVTPLKRALVTNAANPLEIYCLALSRIAQKYGAVVIDAYHNAPCWNPLDSALAHWANADKVHPLPAYSSQFLMPYIMSSIAFNGDAPAVTSKSNFTPTLNSEYYTAPATTAFTLFSDGSIAITLTGTFTNSEATARRVIIGKMPGWSATGKQEWGFAGKLATGSADIVPFYVSAIGDITMDLLPGSNWYFAICNYKI